MFANSDEGTNPCVRRILLSFYFLVIYCYCNYTLHATSSQFSFHLVIRVPSVIITQSIILVTSQCYTYIVYWLFALQAKCVYIDQV